MRLLGVARILRAVLRRWVGGLVSVEDVHFALRSGALELVNVELSVEKAEAFLTRLGISARVVSARAGRISVSLPLSWRRGARVRLDVDSVELVLDAAGRLDAVDEEEDLDARAKAIAAKLDAAELIFETPTPPPLRVKERTWRRAARRVAESVDVSVTRAAACVRLPRRGTFGSCFQSLKIEKVDDDGRWTKTMSLQGVAVYQRRPETSNDDNDGGKESEVECDLFEETASALEVSDDVVLRPCDLRAQLRLSSATTEVAAIDAVFETSSLAVWCISAARCAELADALFRRPSPPEERVEEKEATEHLPRVDALLAFSRHDRTPRSKWHAAIACVLEQEKTGGGSKFANQVLFMSKLKRRSAYVAACKRRNEMKHKSDNDIKQPSASSSSSASGSRWSFLFQYSKKRREEEEAAALLDESYREDERLMREVESGEFDLVALLLFRQVASLASAKRVMKEETPISPRPASPEDEEAPNLSGDLVAENRATEAILKATLARVRLEGRSEFVTTFRDAEDVVISRITATVECRCILSLDDDVVGIAGWRCAARANDFDFVDLTPTAPYSRYAARELAANAPTLRLFDDDSEDDHQWVDFLQEEVQAADGQETTTRRFPTTTSEEDGHGTRVCWIPSVVVRGARGGTAAVAVSIDSRYLDATADWALIARFRAAAQPVLRALTKPDAPSGVLSMPSLEVSADIRDSRVVLPYDSQRDGGAMVLDYELLNVAFPHTTNREVIFCDDFFSSPEANPETFEAIGENWNSLGNARFKADKFRITELAPVGVKDDERPLVSHSSLRGTASVLKSYGRRRRRHIKVDVDITDELIHVVSSGRRLSRVLGVLDTYLHLPVPTAVPEMWTWANGQSPTPQPAISPNGVVIDVRLAVPKSRVVVLPPETSSFFPKTAEPIVQGELVATISELVVCSRQREEPASTRFGFRAQRYNFANAVVDLVEEAFATESDADYHRRPQLLARLVESCSHGGLFEYSATWPPHRPSLNPEMTRSSTLLNHNAAPEALPSDALMKRLVLHSPRVTCALAEVLRAFDAVMSFLKGFQPSSCWSDDDPVFLRRKRSVTSVLFETAHRRLEYVVTNYDVTIVGREQRQPLALCRGSHFRYAIDHDMVSFLERYGRISNFRVDSYRVATACWEPLLEPGADVRVATVTDYGSGDARGIIESSARLDFVLTRDAATALRSLYADAYDLVLLRRRQQQQQKGAATKLTTARLRRHTVEAVTLSRVKDFLPSYAAATEKSPREPKITLTNLTGCFIQLQLFNAEGERLATTCEIDPDAENVPLLEASRDAILVAIDSTATYHAECMLPVSRAVSITVPTLKTKNPRSMQRRSRLPFACTSRDDARFSDEYFVRRQRARRSISSEERTRRHASRMTDLINSREAAASAPIVWQSAFDEHGVLRIECRAALRVRSECGESVTLVSCHGEKMIAVGGSPDEPTHTPAPLSFAGHLFDAKPATAPAESSRPCVRVGDTDVGDVPATLFFEEAWRREKKQQVPWQVATLRCIHKRKHSFAGRVRARLDEDIDWEVIAAANDRLSFERSDSESGDHRTVSSLIITLKAELVLRNTLPLPMEFCVMALQSPVKRDKGDVSPQNSVDDPNLDEEAYHLNEDSDSEHSEADATFKTPSASLKSRKRPIDRGRFSNASSRADRPERVVVRRGIIGSGSCAAVFEADARNYIWLATRCAISASYRRQCAWSVVKLNAKSWRRRVAAARALRRTAPLRAKHMDADGRFSFSVDVEARDEAAVEAGALPTSGSPAAFENHIHHGRTPTSDRRRRGESHNDFLGPAPTYALEVIARAPCVVLDRSGLSGGVIFGRSRVEIDAFRLEQPTTYFKTPMTSRRQSALKRSRKFRHKKVDLIEAWCAANASSLSAAPKAYRVLPSLLRRFSMTDSNVDGMAKWYLAAFDGRNPPSASKKMGGVFDFFTSRRKRQSRLHYGRILADAERHARLVWDLSTPDVAFLNEPRTLVITTSGADARSTTRRSASPWLLRLEPLSECIVLVAFDARADRCPIWLVGGGFTRRCNPDGRYARAYAVETVPGKATVGRNAKRHRFDLYEKVCQARDVIALGPMRSRGDPEPHPGTFMYAVFVIPKNNFRPVLRSLPLAGNTQDLNNTAVDSESIDADGGFSEDEDDDSGSRQGLSTVESAQNLLAVDSTSSLLSRASDDLTSRMNHALITEPFAEDDSSDDGYESAADGTPEKWRLSSSIESIEDMLNEKHSSHPVVLATNVSVEQDRRKLGAEEEDDLFFDARSNSSTGTIVDDAVVVTRQQPDTFGEFLPRLSFLSTDTHLVVSTSPETKLCLSGTRVAAERLDVRLDDADRQDGHESHIAGRSIHELRLSTVAASGEPYPFELPMDTGVAALCAVISSAPPLAGRRAGRVVTIMPRYVVANACRTCAIELAQPGFPYHLMSRRHATFEDVDEPEVRRDSFEEVCDSDFEGGDADSRSLQFFLRDGDLCVAPILRLEPGESAALHWVNIDEPRIAKVRILPPKSSTHNSLHGDGHRPTAWSQGGLQLNSIGSQCIALRPMPSKGHSEPQYPAEISENGISETFVLPLQDAVVLRIESRARAGDGDDFGSLIAIGDQADPVIVCSNETDVLVACWQIMDDDDDAYHSDEPIQSLNRKNASERRKRHRRPGEQMATQRHVAESAMFDASMSKGLISTPTSPSTPRMGPLLHSSQHQRWLVAPRSENGFGWCRPGGSQKIAVVALANRSEGDARVLLSGPEGVALERVAAILSVDEIGASFALPLVDHSGEPSAPPVVLTRSWGVEAVIDKRAGATVVRFVSHAQASFVDLMSEECLHASPRATFGVMPTFEFSRNEKASRSLHGVSATLNEGSLDDERCGSATFSLSEYVGRCDTFSLSIVLDDLDDITSQSAKRSLRARRESLRITAERCEIIAKRAQNSDLSQASKVGTTMEGSIRDFRVESYARERHLGVVLERDRMYDVGDSSSRRRGSFLSRERLEPASRGGDVGAHFSIVRQRDGNADVWRYAGARIAPLAVALDRPTLCALCATIDALFPRGNGSLLGGDQALRADRDRFQEWAKEIRSHAKAPPTLVRARASLAKATPTYTDNYGHDAAPSDARFGREGNHVTPERESFGSSLFGEHRPAASPPLPDVDDSTYRASLNENFRVMSQDSKEEILQDEEKDVPLGDFSDDGGDDASSWYSKSSAGSPKRSFFDASGMRAAVATLPLPSDEEAIHVTTFSHILFAAFSTEPRVYVDTIEFSTLTLRVTLALSARSSSNDLARAMLLRAGALSSSSAALFEMAAPLASLSDTPFRITEFSARHALLTTTELRAALTAHARREAIRNALSALGVSYASTPTQGYLALPRRHRQRRDREDDSLLANVGESASLFRDEEDRQSSRGGNRAMSQDSLMDFEDDFFVEDEAETAASSPRGFPREGQLSRGGGSWLPWLRSNSASSLASPRFAAMPAPHFGSRDDTERLAGLQVILSGNSEYFGERARQHQRRQNSDTCVGIVSFKDLASILDSRGARGLANAFAGLFWSLRIACGSLVTVACSTAAALTAPFSDTTVPARSSSQSTHYLIRKRRRALAALPDGTGIRRRLEPYSAVAAAAQLLAKAAFNNSQSVDGASNDERDFSPMFLAFSNRSHLKKKTVPIGEFEEDPASGDGEPYIDHVQLVGGGLVVLATSGIVVLTRRHRRPPWIAFWKSLRVARVGDECTLLLTRSHRTHRYYAGSSVVRVECPSSADARSLREKLGRVGITVERFDQSRRRGSFSSESKESSGMGDQREDDVEERSSPQEAGILPSWVEAAVIACAESSNTNDRGEQQLCSFRTGGGACLPHWRSLSSTTTNSQTRTI